MIISDRPIDSTKGSFRPAMRGITFGRGTVDGSLPHWDEILGGCAKIPTCSTPHVIAGTRARIECIVLNTGAVPEILNLQIVALCPKDSALGTYVLNGELQGPLASELWNVLNTNSIVGKNADQLLLEIVKKISVDVDNNYSWEFHESLKSVHILKNGSPMERVFPSFEVFAKNPDYALDQSFLARRVIDDEVVSVRANLSPELHRVMFDVKTENSLKEAQSSESFSISLAPNKIAITTSSESAIRELLQITFDAMRQFQQEGLDSMRRFLSPPHTANTEAIAELLDQAEGFESSMDSSIDSRILSGDLHAGQITLVEQLQSGAEIHLHVGNSAAAISIHANGSENSSSVMWPMQAKGDLSDPNHPVQFLLREQVAKLAFGNTDRKMEALLFLDNYAKESCNRSPFFTGCSLDDTLPFELQTDPESFPDIIFNSVSATSPAQRIELLRGIQLVELRYPDSRPEAKGESTNFSRICFGIYPNDSLHIMARNIFGGQLKAKLSAETCNNSGGYREVIRTITEKMSERPAPLRVGMQQLIDDLVHQDIDTNTCVSPLNQFGTQLPPSNNSAANRAYEMAAKLAKIWVKTTDNDASDLRLNWIELTDTCLATIDGIGQDGSSIDITMTERGASKIVINAAYGDDYRKVHQIKLNLHSAALLHLGKNATFFKDIFKHLFELAESAPKHLGHIESSKMYKFISNLPTNH